MKVTIIGQGAIGLLWYHHLHRLQLDVELMCSANIEHIPEVMHFQGIDGNLVSSVISNANIKSLASTHIVIMCLKAYQIEAALEQYLPFINREAVIILSHNGMLSDSQLQSTIKKRHMLLLLTSHGCKKIDNFSIVHTGLGKSQLGSINQPPVGDSAITESRITSVLNTALPEVTWHQDISQLQWLKLAVNCVINPITALHDIDNGEIVHNRFQPKVSAVCHEIAQVAAFEHVQLQPQKLIDLVNQVARDTAKNCSSMRADLMHRRKTENDYINGFIDKLSHEHNIQCPANSSLYQHIVKREQALGITGDTL